ncbi:hypothetical protein M427DRAFT_204787 [Gonapodya prolifera JEL478]|uniref:F-box domain-containing protein n=1 Tax=Gonapodya prolifera (strain JEL478) TaxID=1344416 RepID=A0A138ZZA7_GONPJ|nr:hypothetical protein M427DRAFT_204787 [Gonapodya prolifera JEL478]|eukprot:KXS09842.1 hypothetical protein M427DRAFT_204787 [Gonapodya prolifera JEL478]
MVNVGRKTSQSPSEWHRSPWRHPGKPEAPRTTFLSSPLHSSTRVAAPLQAIERRESRCCEIVRRSRIYQRCTVNSPYQPLRYKTRNGPAKPGVTVARAKYIGNKPSRVAGPASVNGHGGPVGTVYQQSPRNRSTKFHLSVSNNVQIPDFHPSSRRQLLKRVQQGGRRNLGPPPTPGSSLLHFRDFEPGHVFSRLAAVCRSWRETAEVLMWKDRRPGINIDVDTLDGRLFKIHCTDGKSDLPGYNVLTAHHNVSRLDGSQSARNLEFIAWRPPG